MSNIAPLKWSFVLLICILVFPFVGNAQTIIINDIKKINLADHGGGLGGGHQSAYEIIKEKGNWKCYQTKLYYYGHAFSEPADGRNYTKLNSDEHKFIKNIDVLAIDRLLQSLKQRKPVFKPEYISFNLAYVIRKVDSAFFKGPYNRYTPKQRQQFIALLKNKKITDEAVAFMQTNYATDFWPGCSIHIIKKNNDTLKIETNSQFDYMLPWKVNGADSYNTGFSQFLIYAMGDHYASQKDLLSGENVFYGIFEYINREYASDLFERERMQKHLSRKRSFT